MTIAVNQIVGPMQDGNYLADVTVEGQRIATVAHADDPAPVSQAVAQAVAGGAMSIQTWTHDADNALRQAVNPSFTVPGLAAVKDRLKKQVDADAERVRLAYITPGDGMQMVYREKFEQATAVHGMGQAAADAMSQQDREASFPTLSASIGIEAATLWDCANLVLQRYTVFAQLSLAIERTRLAGKKAISDAGSITAAQAAYGAITWTV